MGGGASVVTHSDGAGMIWEAALVPDEFDDKHHCTDGDKLKPCQRYPHIKAADLFANLEKTSDGRWIFKQALNEWPALTELELRYITTGKKLKRHSRGSRRTGMIWDGRAEGQSPSETMSVSAPLTAVFRGPDWTAEGWSPNSPGFFFWFARRADGSPAVRHGEATLEGDEAGDLPGWGAEAVRCHHFAHRYAKQKETFKDKLIYHGAVLLEWKHGQHCTVVELAWYNGLGGYDGKSNWLPEKDVSPTPLFQAMGDEMKGPWNVNRSEIRAIDIPVKSADEFKAYLAQHTDRFIDPHVKESKEVCVPERGQKDIARYLLNYIKRNPSYNEMSRNCQTFAADFFSFLGAKTVTPYSRVSRMMYTPRIDDFKT